jgi:hypothetical protein
MPDPASWYQRHFGNGQPAAPAAPQLYPASVLPRGIVPNQQAVVADYLNRAPAYQPPSPPPQDAYNEDPIHDPYGHHTRGRVFSWRGNARGGASEQEVCPQCGSGLYFSRRNAGGVTTERGVFYPASQCMDCGFDSSRPDQGYVSVLPGGGSAKIQRQAEAPPPPGTVAHLRRTR